MDSGDRAAIETKIRDIVSRGGPGKERVWKELKQTFQRNKLDPHRAEIHNLYTECLEDIIKGHAPRSPRTSAASGSGALQPKPRAAQQRTDHIPASSSQSIADPKHAASSRRKPKFETGGFIQVGSDGFHLLQKHDGAFFFFSNKETHWISRHYIDQRPQLARQVKNGKVNLPFSIESRHKSYKLDFKVRDGLEYDVVLGKHWDGEMELDENDSRARINRNAKTRDQDTVAVDSTCPVNLPPFSHFTAEAYHHLFTLSSQSPPRQPSPQTRLPPQHEPREEHLPPHTSYQMRRTSDDILPFEKRALTKENLCRLDSSEESVNGTDTFDNNGLELIESRTSVTNSKDNDSEDSEGGGVLLFKGRNTLRE